MIEVYCSVCTSKQKRPGILTSAALSHLQFSHRNTPHANISVKYIEIAGPFFKYDY